MVARKRLPRRSSSVRIEKPSEKPRLSRFSLENYFLNDPEIQNHVDMSYLSHKEKYEEAIRRVTVVMKKIRHLQQSEGQNGAELLGLV